MKIKPHNTNRSSKSRKAHTMTLPIENYIIRQYKHCAARRNIPFLLTNDEVVKFFDLPCVYCGATHSNTATRKQYAVKVWNYNGIDRVNSDQSYALGNVVACCKLCNAAKTDMNPATFLASDWLKSRISSVKGE